VDVRVNGEVRVLADGTTLPELLTSMGLGTGWVVVERNGTALLRSETEKTVLEDGDVLEVVRAVAGG
jgi:sulfur carrier protein